VKIWGDILTASLNRSLPDAKFPLPRSLHAHLNAQADALSRRGSPRGFNSVGLLMLDDIDPFHLGALMATLEHATACAGWMWGVNSFDQPGVELGKKLAAEVRRSAARHGPPA